MNGIVLVDKPAGWTSHDVVNRWRRLAKTKRAGHLGTLDPMATGLLALMTGPATRLAQYFGREEKTYRAEITLGLVSDSYDAEGEVWATGAVIPEGAAIRAALEKFKGRQWQTPPAVSAKKVHGVAAYELARKNVPVELKPVEVEIRRLEVEDLNGAQVRVLMTSSTGTYVRSVAHDLGQALGCGAILSALRRLEIGRFCVSEARTLEELENLAEAARLPEAVISGERLLPQFPAERFSQEVEAQIRQGRDFRTSPFVVPPGSPFVKALSDRGELIAIGELRIPNVYHPSTVL